MVFVPLKEKLFQHTAARRRLPKSELRLVFFNGFQHTAARRRLLYDLAALAGVSVVSTHSRAEAAASGSCENTPPFLFQHTAARRRLLYALVKLDEKLAVSTHSRAEAAELLRRYMVLILRFQHTAARRRLQINR